MQSALIKFREILLLVLARGVFCVHLFFCVLSWGGELGKK